jgi:hypothetical protein
MASLGGSDVCAGSRRVVLTGYQVLRHHVVTAALNGAEYGIEHATDQFDPADDQPVDVFAVQELSRPGKRCLLRHQRSQ